MQSLLSPAQVLGYLALVLGVSGFLQRDDRRLKRLVAAECFAYVAHFALLGVPSASSSALVSGVRTALSIRFRSAWLAAATVAVNVGLALAFSTHGAGWVPVVGSSLGAVAVFTMRGIPMRLVLLSSTACWLANNVLSGSIGGTVLESLIAAASVSTIVRMTLDEITSYRHEQIPMTRSLGVRVEHYDGTSVRLAAPLEPNSNHHDTAFGGSLSSLAILSGWVLVHLQLRERGIASGLVIQRSAMEFEAPVDGDFTATAVLPPAAAWNRFLATLSRHRAARVTVSSTVACPSGEGGRHEGTYVAVRS